MYCAYDSPAPSLHKPARLMLNGLKLSAERVLAFVKGYNTWLKGEIVLLLPQAVTDSSTGQQHVLLGLDDEAAASMALTGWQVDLGIARKKILYTGKQELRSRLMHKGGFEDAVRVLEPPPGATASSDSKETETVEETEQVSMDDVI